MCVTCGRNLFQEPPADIWKKHNERAANPVGRPGRPIFQCANIICAISGGSFTSLPGFDSKDARHHVFHSPMNNADHFQPKGKIPCGNS